MELNELKPCPFCGSKYVKVKQCDADHVLKKYHGKYFAGCVNCGITTPLFNWNKTRSPLINESNKNKAREKAINAWNRRANDE